jgi:septal ring factor EnvC (AmiA/AmiB activator)
MKRLIPLLFLATPAMAQQAPAQQMQQQLDGMSAGVMRVMTTLTSQVASDQQQIEALQKQIQTLTAEKADLEKKGAPPAEATKPQ